MYKTIVVGTDGTETALRALDEAIELARLSAATLHVVTAYRPLSEREVTDRLKDEAPREHDDVDDAEAARGLLAKIGQRAAARGITTELRAELGDPGDVIVRVARQVEADLIVVGNKGMTGLRRFLGSVPNHVSHHASCSVLIVRTV